VDGIGTKGCGWSGRDDQVAGAGRVRNARATSAAWWLSASSPPPDRLGAALLALFARRCHSSAADRRLRLVGSPKEPAAHAEGIQRCRGPRSVPRPGQHTHLTRGRPEGGQGRAGPRIPRAPGSGRRPASQHARFASGLLRRVPRGAGPGEPPGGAKHLRPPRREGVAEEGHSAGVRNHA